MDEKVDVVEVLMLGFQIPMSQTVTFEQFHDASGLSEVGARLVVETFVRYGWVTTKGETLTITKLGIAEVNQRLAEPR
jgi:hypothetical protein